MSGNNNRLDQQYHYVMLKMQQKKAKDHQIHEKNPKVAKDSRKKKKSKYLNF